MYRENPLDKQLNDLRTEVASLRATSSPKVHLHWNWSEWRWPLSMLAALSIVCATFSGNYHPDYVTSKPAVSSTTRIFPSHSHRRGRTTFSPSSMRGLYFGLSYSSKPTSFNSGGYYDKYDPKSQYASGYDKREISRAIRWYPSPVIINIR